MDVSGQDAVASLEVTQIDKSLPEITKLAANADKSIHVEAKDVESGVAAVQVSQSGTPDTQDSAWIKLDTAQANITWNSQPYEGGTYNVWVKDAVGNVSADRKECYYELTWGA